MGWFSRSKPDVVFLPQGMRVTTEAYLQAIERVMATNDGKIIAAALQEKLFGALTMSCPPALRTAEDRSQWLAARDMLVSCRKEFRDDWVMNVKLLPPTQSPQKRLPTMGAKPKR